MMFFLMSFLPSSPPNLLDLFISKTFVDQLVQHLKKFVLLNEAHFLKITVFGFGCLDIIGTFSLLIDDTDPPRMVGEGVDPELQYKYGL